jgi:DNA-binding transcriptional MocR family regulator
MTQTLEKEDLTLYERVVSRVMELISTGTLRPGGKLPSVRKMSTQLKVSVSTILQAYRILEDRGVIVAKPQSGYYVRMRTWQPPPEPEMSRPAPVSRHVTVSDRTLGVLEAARHPEIVPLGAAIAAAEILPIRQLNRLMSAIGRRSTSIGAGYDLPPGCEPLRVQIARRTMESGCAISPDDIITTLGGQEALQLCLRAVARPGDTIAIESPTYYGILQTIEVLGMKALEIPTHPREGVSLEALKQSLDQHDIRACLFVPTFNNPLGSLMPDANKKKLVEMLSEYEVPLIEDDIYGDIGFGENPRPICCKAFDTEGIVLLCSSFSKTLAPGLRCGWTAAGRWSGEVSRAKLFTTLANTTITHMAVAEFLAAGHYEHHLRRMRKTYAEQVDRIQQAISEYFPQGTKATRPAGGFVLWVELPEQIDAMQLHDRALAEKISIAPGPIFSASEKFRNFIRLNCGYPWSEKIDHAMMRLGRIMGEMR